MEDWGVEYINQYFAKTQSGKVQCELTERKGRILVSKAAFGQGQALFEERPLHIVQAAEGNAAYKALERLCKRLPGAFDQDALWYWAALSSLTPEDLGEGPRKGSLPTVAPDTQRKILCLYHEAVEQPSEAAVALVEEFRLAASTKKVDELIRAWILNCFDHSEKPPGYAAYFGASFMSHSCDPNAIWHFAEGTAEEDTFVLKARRSIAPGEEITISYLPEAGLLQSAQARKRELQSTKSFVCTCERCGPSAAEPDLCRGFRCPTCFGQVFHPGPLKGLTLSTAVCRGCGQEVGVAEGRRLLAAETELAARIQRLDGQVEKKLISKVLKEAEVQHLLRCLGDSAAGSLGPQHWLCPQLWAHLADYYDQTGREEDACRMQRLRVDYMRAGYKGLHGELAWTLETKADALLKCAGLGPKSLRLAGLDDAAVRRVAMQAAADLEEAAGIMSKLFSSTHSYFLGIERKRLRVQEFLDTGAWPAAAKRRRVSE